MTVVDHHGAPAPEPAGKDHPPREFFVPLDVFLIKPFVFVVVVPVDQIHVLGSSFDDLFRHLPFQVVVVPGLRSQPEVHIAPHHGAQPVTAQDLHDPVQMPADDGKAVLITMLLQEMPQPQIHCLVHAYMDPFGTEGTGDGGDHGFDESVGLFVVAEKDAGRVGDRLHLLPAEGVFQMPQRLDAGDQLDAQGKRIVVQLF